MPSPRAGALVASAAVVSLLSACGPPPGGTLGATSSGGFLVVTAGGTALVDGQSDVPPTLDLRVATTLSADQVEADLDGSRLPLRSDRGGALTAIVKPMP